MTPAPTNEVAIGLVVPNTRQPRTVFDEDRLRDLSESIRQHGILQPLVVQPLENGRYELIAGERRLRAAQLAGLSAVPIHIRAADARSSLEMAIVENVQREDIGPMECARAYRKLMDEFALTQEKVAERVGKSRVAIANTVRLLRLPLPVQEALEKEAIQEGHARALLGLDSEALQLALLVRILSEGLNVREVERAARAPQRQHASRTLSEEGHPELEEALSQAFGSRVKFVQAEAGGKIVVEFYSDEDLGRILDRLGIEL